MLKFRFRKQNLRRRSNSCPNLERQNDDTCVSPVLESESSKDVQAKENVDNISFESASDNEPETLPKKERLKFQRSIRRVKKREKEKQENSEKNLLSMDDYYGKLTLLKEWLLEQGKKDIGKISSPKMKSHFKAFVKLWNKRKLPAQYYRSCCVDSVDNLSESVVDNPSSPAPSMPQLYGDVNGLPSYHRFPPVDEPDPSWRSLLKTPSPFKSRPMTVADSLESPLFTFGKSTANSKSPDSFQSFQILQSIGNQRQKKETTFGGSTHAPIDKGNSVTSPTKFASVSRSMFKPSGTTLSPRLHPVLSPTCPLTSFSFPDRTKTLPNSFSMGTMDSPLGGRQSPAYVSVKDAIHYESPEYEQIREFESENIEPTYCSVSSLLQLQEGKRGIATKQMQKKNPGLNRRRSKSMEDIYAVPIKFNSMKLEAFPDFLHEESMSTTPPVPEKNFRLLDPSSPWDNSHDFTFSPPNPFSAIESGHSSYASQLQATNTPLERKGEINVFPVQSMNKSESYESHSNISANTEMFVSSTKSQFSSSTTLDKPGSKRRSQDKENFVAESTKDSLKKAKSLESSHFGAPAQAKPKSSILTGSLNPTTRTPSRASKDEKASQSSTRLSILQIKQLDSSPTFPRRRIKRRSSNLTTTPGKNLAFGSKTLSYAKSSPRRVSFAKDVKDTEKKNTPRRSSGRHTTRDKSSKIDVTKQLQDRLEFESFWSEPGSAKDKKSSPKRGSPGKAWSPSKNLSSPSDHHPNIFPVVTAGKESQDISPKTQTFTTLPSKNSASSEGSSPRTVLPFNQTQDFGFSLSLSPSKIVSRLKQSISSSSLLQKNDEICKDKSIAHTDQSASPKKSASYLKSILKKKDSVECLSSSSNTISVTSLDGNTTLPPRQEGRRVLGPPSSTSFRDTKHESSFGTTKPLDFNFRLQRDLNISNSKLDKPPSLEFDKYLIEKTQANRSSCEDKGFVAHSGEKRSEHVKITKTLFDQKSSKIVQDNTEFRGHNKTDSLKTDDIPNSKTESFSAHEQPQVQCIKLDMIERPGGPIAFEGECLAKEYGKNSKQNTLKTCDEDCTNAMAHNTRNNVNYNHVPGSSFYDELAAVRKADQSQNSSIPIEENDSCKQTPLDNDSSPSRLLKACAVENDGSPSVDPPGQRKTNDNRRRDLGRYESMKASLSVVDNDSWITARRKSSVKHRERKLPPDFTTGLLSSEGVSSTESDSVDSIQGNKRSYVDGMIFTSQSNISASSLQEEGVSDSNTITTEKAPDVDPCLIVDCAPTSDNKSSDSPNRDFDTAQSVSESESSIEISTRVEHIFSHQRRSEKSEELQTVNDGGCFDSISSISMDLSNKKECSAVNNETEALTSKPIKTKSRPAVLPKPSMRLKSNPLSSVQKFTAGNAVTSRPTIKKRISITRKEIPLSNSSPLSNHDTSKENVFSERSSKESVQVAKNINARNQRRRSSLTPKKRRSGSKELTQSGHPHIASFAQRRKFFQQREESGGPPTSRNATSSNLTHSASRLQTRPKPQVKPKPRRSKIGSSFKELNAPS